MRRAKRADVTILVCAATRPELDACARGIRASGAVPGAFEMLLTGVGPVRAAKRLGARLEGGERPSLVVSSGFAGVLTAGIEVGSWVTATRVTERRSDALVEVGEVTLREGPEPALPCSVISSGHLLLGDASPRNAGNGSALAVDMESAALAREAGKRDTVLMVLRLVSDTPQQPLPGFLAPIAAAMAATGARSMLAHAARGICSAFVDPRGVVRIVRDGAERTRELAQGWECFARAIG
jgi:nucleoside phosphorylase